MRFKAWDTKRLLNDCVRLFIFLSLVDHQQVHVAGYSVVSLA